MDHKKEQLDIERRQKPLERLMEEAEGAEARRGFGVALRQPGLGLIAEVKKASPTAGQIRASTDMLAIVEGYEAGGAACLSVLTEERYFQGSMGDLVRVREKTTLPIMRKDFLFDEYHLYQARAGGADAVLLIAFLFSEVYLRDFLLLAAEIGLESLVEVHTVDEAERAVSAGADIFGINNRDLKTMEVDLKVTERVRPAIPNGKVVVSESGVKDRDDVDFLRAQGIDALLIGEVLMRSDDVPSKMAELGLAR